MKRLKEYLKKIFRTQDGTLRCGWLLALGLLVTAGLRDAVESAAAFVAGAFALPLAAGGMGVTLLANTTQAAARWAGCAAMGAGALMSWHFFTKRPLSEMGLGVGRGCARRFGLGAAQGAAGALAVFGALAAVGLVKVEVLAPALRATAIERALFYGAVALAHGLFYQGFCLCVAKRLHGVWGTWGAVALAALLYVTIATGLGLLISTFMKSQIAAIFGTAIITLIPATQFSGMIDPVASLEGPGRWIGQIYPTSHFLTIARGTFSKALNISDLWGSFIPLLIAVPLVLGLSVLLLKKQEG